MNMLRVFVLRQKLSDPAQDPAVRPKDEQSDRRAASVRAK